jgi:hypothetical protein
MTRADSPLRSVARASHSLSCAMQTSLEHKVTKVTKSRSTDHGGLSRRRGTLSIAGQSVPVEKALELRRSGSEFGGDARCDGCVDRIIGAEPESFTARNQDNEERKQTLCRTLEKATKYQSYFGRNRTIVWASCTPSERVDQLNVRAEFVIRSTDDADGTQGGIREDGKLRIGNSKAEWRSRRVAKSENRNSKFEWRLGCPVRPSALCSQLSASAARRRGQLSVQLALDRWRQHAYCRAGRLPRPRLSNWRREHPDRYGAEPIPTRSPCLIASVATGCLQLCRAGPVRPDAFMGQWPHGEHGRCSSRDFAGARRWRRPGRWRGRAVLASGGRSSRTRGRL